MIRVRTVSERAHANHGWLDTYHTFSFADYHDPKHMGFRSLRVINEDRVEAAQGFGTHPHRDMEIITYVLEGALEHKDSMGNGSVIRPGDVQRMSAGTGVLHSEFNASKTEPVHLLQIWIQPDSKGVAPGYEEKRVPREEISGKLKLLASPAKESGVVKLHQNARVYAAVLKKGEAASHDFEKGRGGWLQVARGFVELNQLPLSAGDGASIEDDPKISIRAKDDSEILLFDLA